MGKIVKWYYLILSVLNIFLIFASIYRLYYFNESYQLITYISAIFSLFFVIFGYKQVIKK